MNNTMKNFLDEVSEAIVEIKKEVEKRNTGISGDGNVYQLEIIKSELEQIAHQIQAGALPEKKKRYTAFSRYVLDEWDIKSSLGKKLCDLANKYKRRI